MVAHAAESAGARRVVWAPRRAELAERLHEVAVPGDLVLTMGAGDVTTVGRELLRLLGGR